MSAVGPVARALHEACSTRARDDGSMKRTLVARGAYYLLAVAGALASAADRPAARSPRPVRKRGRSERAFRSSDTAPRTGPPLLASIEHALTSYFESSERRSAQAAARETEAQLRGLEEQVRETQKLEPLGLLAGGIAHDFNNILAVIGSSVGLLEEDGPDPDTAELLHEVQRAVARGAALTQQLLAFSRKQAAQPVILDLNGAIADTRKMLARMVGEDVAITTSLAPDLAPVCVDPGGVVQILMNLAVNARDAMPHGGQLAISTRNTRASGGPEVVLAIADTGCGMTEETRRRAFEPLFTTKAVGRGTGLGLSVVRGIVESAGGRIEVVSELGRGTTIQIALPAADAPVDPRDQAALEALTGVETVVFVDDDVHVRAVAARALRSRGYQVIEAGDGAEALALLRSATDRIDLLVTDVVMPGLNGRELGAAALAARPSLRVLYTSGYTLDELARTGLDRAAVAFLEKPYDVRRLASRVRALLDA
jgi:signal transduction histidine kinase